MHIFFHLSAGVSLFCVRMSGHCDFFETRASQRQGDVVRVIAKGLDSAQRLPELSANDIYAAGGSSDCRRDGACFFSAGKSWS